MKEPIGIDSKHCRCIIEGAAFPLVGFGTGGLSSDNLTAEIVEQAIKVGYRVIDTATFYNNFAPLALALKDKKRTDFYLISKAWYDKQIPADLYKDLEATLQQLNTIYIDAYFLHWPNSKVSIESTLVTLAVFKKLKLIRHIGLANVTVNHLKRALEVGIPITWVQVEMNPYFYDEQLLQFCQQHGIAVQAWASLGRGRISNDQLLAKIGQKYGKTASQVAIRWITQHGCMPLVGSKNEKHMHANFNIADFSLAESEMEEINARARVGQRERVTVARLGFDDEFDFTYEQCWPKKFS